MDRKDFEISYESDISKLAKSLYTTYCNSMYEPHNLDYPEWCHLPADTGKLFWDTAVTLYMQELPYLEEGETL
jgi:hypothetical protein